MSTIRLKSGSVFDCGSIAVALLVAAFVNLPAYAQVTSGASDAGRVDFDFADAPAATVEVDLQEGMLSAITGIGQAAVQGVAEALVESGQGAGSEAVRQSADHLQSTNDILEIVSQVIREVRVRVYENLAEQTENTRASMVKHYQSKLDGTNWANVVRVRDEDDSVVVCVLQHESAIRGLFIMVSDRDDLVLVNVVCQLTPESVRQLTNQATKIGMKAGLEDVIEEALKRIDRRQG